MNKNERNRMKAVSAAQGRPPPRPATRRTAEPGRPTASDTVGGPLPSPRQLLWHEREFYGFVHFTVNTFTDKEWGYGDEDPRVFAPTDFDADQIAGTAAEAGMKALILTCKHHDGFCLWPSRYTEHSVKRSPWRNGKGDMVKEFSEACRRRGLEFGVYLSPWDRNHPEYGRPAYIDYYRNQLRELLTGYGPICQVWFDGANGGDGYYGGARERRNIDRLTYYDWPGTWQLVRELQPDAVMFSDIGPDVRWVGNESGWAGYPCWATYTPLGRDGAAPGVGATVYLEAQNGHRGGGCWMPAEACVSIRPGWFYHAAEDAKVRTARNLAQLYAQTVGRGAALHLNLPPDRRGRIHEADVRSLREFRAHLDATFVNLARHARVIGSGDRSRRLPVAPATAPGGNRDVCWRPAGGRTAGWMELRLPAPVTFNMVSLRESLPFGQRIDCWALDRWDDGAWLEFARGSAIGNRYLWTGERLAAARVRLRIIGATAAPVIREFALHLEPEWPKL